LTQQIDFDIDIDMRDREDILRLIPHVNATVIRDGVSKPHNTGVYFQKISNDPLTGRAQIDHHDAEAEGYVKVDFLNNSIYQGVRNPQHLRDLVAREPMWDMLKYPEIVAQLYHIGNYYDLVSAYTPRTVEQLAMVLALIRPAKRHLQGLAFEDLTPAIWQKPDDGSYYFKRSHSIAFATAIVVQMNLLAEEAARPRFDS
jgi:hypothetical protein